VSRTGHLALVMPAMSRGGVERSVLNLLGEWAGVFERIDLLVGSIHPQTAAEVPEGVRLVRLRERLPVPLLDRLVLPRTRTALALVPELAGYLRRERPDAVLSLQSHALVALAHLLARSRARLVVREGNTPSAAFATDPGWKRWAKLRLKRWAYGRADAVVANSQALGDDLLRAVGLPRRRLHVIYNPTATGRVTALAREPAPHPWLEPGSGVPVVVAVGRITHQKDYPTLVGAFGRVRAQRPCRLVIAGDGEERSAVEALAAGLGIAGDVVVLGFVDNPYAVMARASVFALSSRYEGLPNALIEAQALGVPCVSTDCPSGPREILLDGEAGTLVPVGDDAALGAAIARYLDDHALAQAHAEAGRAALARFDPAASAARYAALLRGEAA
jgi:glycosyltransferase involved in cell wall biosynthesis